MLRHGARYKVSLGLVIIFTGIANANLSFIIHPEGRSVNERRK